MVRAAGRLLPLCVVACSSGQPAHADCIDDAARRHGVNPIVLRAIGWHESRLRPHALNRNRNGTWDVGAFQMNSVHFARLAAHGTSPHSLWNGCTAAHVAAAHMATLMRRHGNTWHAIGAYHSATPRHAVPYAQAIAGILTRWGVGPPRRPTPAESPASPAPLRVEHRAHCTRDARPPWRRPSFTPPTHSPACGASASGTSLPRKEFSRHGSVVQRVH